MSAVALRVDRLSKRYQLGQRQQYTALRDIITELAAVPFRRFTHMASASSNSIAVPSRREQLWALQDVTFEVTHGEVIGVIGSNGAGKSTLLKILSRITEPTSGSVEIHGRVGSLLEVGTGFHPELTGRENIYLNGAILGMHRAEIARKFDEIVAFAEMDKFIDTVVKRYSTGMYMRLAFAVAANLEPEILIVDEVLAVGDAAFQKKCLGKMGSVAKSGRTVLFVSHNMDAIQRLCSRCVLFEGGRLVAQGATGPVVERYIASHSNAHRPLVWIDLGNADRRGTGEAQVRAVQYRSDSSTVDFRPYAYGPVEFTLEIQSNVMRLVRSVAIRIYNRAGAMLINADTILQGQAITLHQGDNQVKLRIAELYLNPGEYQVGLRLANPIGTRPASGALDYIESAFEIEVVSLDPSEVGSSLDAVVPCRFEII